MGVGEAVFYASLLLFVVAGLTVGVAALVKVWRSRPRDLSDTIAGRLAAAREVNGAPVIGVPLHVWNLDGRHATVGDTWPEHDEDADEDGCWCRGCYEVTIELLQAAEVRELFDGLVDTPELRDLAERARRWVR